MLFEVDDWVRYAQKQRRFSRNNSFYGDPQITHTVSKHFKGGHRQDQIRTHCESPIHCAHLHFPGSLNCNSLESADCDSKFSRKNITGEVKAGYQATFGHDEVSQIKEALFKQRGYFFGGFGLERDDQNVLSGVMDGNCNIGVVRKPLEEPVEECHHVGRWYGRIQAGVRLPKGEHGFLTANIAIDMTYNETPSYLETEFVGTIEGMLIRECKKATK